MAQPRMGSPLIASRTVPLTTKLRGILRTTFSWSGTIPSTAAPDSGSAPMMPTVYGTPAAGECPRHEGNAQASQDQKALFHGKFLWLSTAKELMFRAV